MGNHDNTTRVNYNPSAPQLATATAPACAPQLQLQLSIAWSPQSDLCSPTSTAWCSKACFKACLLQGFLQGLLFTRLTLQTFTTRCSTPMPVPESQHLLFIELKNVFDMILSSFLPDTVHLCWTAKKYCQNRKLSSTRRKSSPSCRPREVLHVVELSPISIYIVNELTIKLLSYLVCKLVSNTIFKRVTISEVCKI